MKPNKQFIRYARFVLYAVFAVILAGSVVRTTHSGMGCPDWPTCFGRLIPPLNAGQLPPDYEKYLSKQDIDHSFNVYHTWTEYVNRLCGVALGIMIVVLIIWSFIKKNLFGKKIFYWSLVLLLLFLSEALIGWALVASNLNVWTLTAHMLPALLMGAVCVIIIFITEAKEKITDRKLLLFLWLAFIALFVQIFIGTQVRAEVDIVSKSLQYTQRELWLKNIGNFLQAHEIFAWFAAICCIAVAGKSFNYAGLQKNGIIIITLALAEMLLGLIMTQLKMPAFAQPLHLLFSSVLIITVFAQILRVKRK